MDVDQLKEQLAIEKDEEIHLKQELTDILGENSDVGVQE